MLSKLVKIHNVGRFENMNAQGNVEFKKLTLIYGENGAGKTTLASVLRSAATGDVAFVAERRTLGTAGASAVELRCSSGIVQLSATGWNRTEPNIEIFDTDFVSMNVYTGEHVEVDHRRNLYDVVIGDAAVSLAREVDELDTKSRAVSREISKTESTIRDRMHAPFDLDEFIALAPELDVDRKIAETTAQLDATRRAKEIVARPNLTEVRCPNAPRNLLAVLGVTVTKMGTAAQRKVEEHLNALGRGGEAWLRHGLERTKTERCPFCGQSIAENDLLNLYREFFSSEYKEHVIAIQRAQNCYGSPPPMPIRSRQLMGIAA